MLFFLKFTGGKAGFVTVVLQYQGKWLFLRDRGRKSLSFPTGYRMPAETPLEAARRLLRQVCGAAAFSLWPITIVGVLRGTDISYGQLCYACVESGAADPLAETAVPCNLDDIYTGFAKKPVAIQLLEKVERWQTDRYTLLYCVSCTEENHAQLPGEMKGCSIDSVYACTDEGQDGFLAPMAKEKRLAVKIDGGFGKAGVAAFREAGAGIFSTLLDKENGRSVALGIHSGLFDAIRREYQGFLPVDEDEAFRKYKMPGELAAQRRKNANAAASQKLKLLRLIFIDDVLIGVEDAWMKDS